MGMSMFGSATIPVIVGICALTGYLIKKIAKDDDRLHDFIPTIVCIEGVILALIDMVVSGSQFTLSTIFAGMASGVASTGFHQMITRWVESVDGEHVA